MTSIHRSKEWAALVKRVRPSLEALVQNGEAVCVDCGNPVLPGEAWQVGHRLAASLYPEHALADWNVGPSHSGKGRACNQRAGGSLGARKTNARRKRRANGQEYIKW